MTRAMRRIWGGWSGPLKIAACLAILSGCKRTDVVPPEAPTVVGTPPIGFRTVTAADLATIITVCPQHDSVWVPAKIGALFWTRRATLAMPGTLTQIPEFHDCQRLLSANGSEYGPEAGVYADSAVADLLDTAKLLENGSDSLKAVGVATIVSDGEYNKLWIERGINCLYLYTKNQKPRAFMMSVPDGQDCAKRVAVQTANPLFVDEEPETTPFTKADFSPAARWDWDNRANNKFQFIGLPCGIAYCLYGHPGAISSFRHDRLGMSPKARRVWRMRPWYDEQILGVIPTGGTNLVPSGVFGTVFPHPDLNDRNDLTYENADPAYLLAAEIKLQATIPQYQSKFGLEATTDSTNKVYLCKGPSQRCIPQSETVPTCPAGTTDFWYAKIVSASGSLTKYRCVVRHLHPNFPIPGNARWWWDPRDEGIWVRCPQGCCQVS